MQQPIISYCLCSYNDLDYLKILFASIKNHCPVPHEICLCDNGDKDGTEEWVKKEASYVKYIKNPNGNEGTAGVNRAVQISSGQYVFNINADHYFMPYVDVYVLKYLSRYPNYLISTNVIEPEPYNQKYIYFDAGKNAKEFDEDKLLRFYRKQVVGKTGQDIISISHPVACSREMWDKIGGVDGGYFPGWAGDIDWSHRAYDLGAKQIMCKAACVYHFVSKTLKQVSFDPIRQDAGKKGEERFRSKFGLLPEEWKKTIGDGYENTNT